MKTEQLRNTKNANLLICFAALLAVITGGAAYAAITISAPVDIAYSAQGGATMQSFTSSICAEMDTYTTQVLTDTRNDQDYRVRKMSDGHCWMIDNLKLAGHTLTGADSDVSENFAIPSAPVQNAATRLTNGVCVSGGITGSGELLTCDGSSIQSVDNNKFIAYTDPSLLENPHYNNCIKRNNISVDSITGCGYLYNWYTATAGTGTFATETNANASSSICPAGWSLPTGGGGGQFAVLNGAMATGSAIASTDDNASTHPNWFYNGPFEGVLAGFYGDFWDYTGTTYGTGFSGNAGHGGFYWSSTAFSADKSYDLDFRYNDLWPAGVNSKIHAMAVRCVLK